MNIRQVTVLLLALSLAVPCRVNADFGSLFQNISSAVQGELGNVVSGATKTAQPSSSVISQPGVIQVESGMPQGVQKGEPTNQLGDIDAGNGMTAKAAQPEETSAGLGNMLAGAVSPQTKTQSESQTVTVVAKGVGESVAGAEKAALRTAVESVVGQLVDAKTLVENDELIDDYILTYANGFVKTYELLGEPKKSDDGLYAVKISALVEKGQIAKKINDTIKTEAKVDGRGLFAQALTRQSQIEDASAMLDELFSDIPLKLLKGDVVKDSKGNPSFQFDATSGNLLVEVELGVDPERYETWVSDLVRKFDKMSISSDKTGFFSGNLNYDHENLCEETARAGMDAKGSDVCCAIVLVPATQAMYDFMGNNCRFKVYKYYFSNEIKPHVEECAKKMRASYYCTKTSLVEADGSCLASECGGTILLTYDFVRSSIDNMAQAHTPSLPFVCTTGGFSVRGGGSVSWVMFIPGWCSSGYFASKMRVCVNMGKFDPDELKTVDRIECEPILAPKQRWDYSKGSPARIIK